MLEKVFSGTNTSNIFFCLSGDGEDDEHLVPAGLENDDRRPVITVKGDRSHLIVWQVTLTE